MKKGGKDGNYVQAHGAEGGDSINEYALKSSIFVEDDDLRSSGSSLPLTTVQRWQSSIY